MIAINIVYAIAKCFDIYMYMILVRCLLTFLPFVNWKHPIIHALRASVDLYLDLFRKFIPPIGMFDFSPIVAMFVLVFIRRAILSGLIFIMSQMGMVG
jgi:YggT family protein